MDISKAILFKAHEAAGMSLTEDEDIVTLAGATGTIARWNATKVTIDELRRAADQALGIEFRRPE